MDEDQIPQDVLDEFQEALDEYIAEYIKRLEEETK